MPVVAAPPGFDLAAFALATLRAAGLRNHAMALRLAQLPITAPPLLFGYLEPVPFGAFLSWHPEAQASCGMVAFENGLMHAHSRSSFGVSRWPTPQDIN
jgi:hypothetical protein